MENKVKTDIVMAAARENYRFIRLAYKENYTYALETNIRLLKICCEDYPSILIALSNFETSFENRGKDKVTTELLKELGQAIKAERRKLR